MTNDSPLIILRNQAIIWITLAIIGILGSWWVHGYFSTGKSDTLGKIETLRATLDTLNKEGVITEKKWEDLSADDRAREQWSTMTQLVPHLTKFIGTNPTSSAKNLATMMSISNKIGGDENYISWLEKSWTSDSEATLMKTQSDIAEVIPVFAGITDGASIQNITGKITLKSLIQYIQRNIVDKFDLSNAFGQIGIESVKFLDKAPEIGVYALPLQFDDVSSENVINLLKFLGQTGGIYVTENGKDITIQQRNPLTTKGESGQSGLRNLLINVSDLTVSPSKKEKGDIANITTNNDSHWDIAITLQFYIRGVSTDYIANLDTIITSLLNPNNASTSLITRGNTLLKKCSGCIQSTQLRDIIELLGQAQTAYNRIIEEEKGSKTGLSPITIIERRTKLMTTLQTLADKLTALDSIISNSK